MRLFTLKENFEPNEVTLDLKIHRMACFYLLFFIILPT